MTPRELVQQRREVVRPRLEQLPDDVVGLRQHRAELHGHHRSRHREGVEHRGVGEQVRAPTRWPVEGDDAHRGRDVTERDELDGCLVDTRQPVRQLRVGADDAVHVDTEVLREIHQLGLRS